MAKIFNTVPESVPTPPEPPKVEMPEALKGKSSEEVFKALSEEHDRVLKEAVNDVKAKFATPPEPKPAPPAPAPGPAPQPQPGGYPPTDFPGAASQGEPDPGLEPGKYLDNQLAQRVTPYVTSMVAAGRETGRSLLATKVGEEDWKAFGAEIETFVDQLDPKVQANPKSYTVAYNYVRAMHLDEIVSKQTETKANKKLKDALTKLGVDEAQMATVLRGEGPAPAPEGAAQSSLFSAPTGTQVPTTVPTKPPVAPAVTPGAGKAPLTDEEKILMGQFKMTEDEWREYRGQNTDIISELRSGGMK